MSWTQPGQGYFLKEDFTARAKERFPKISNKDLDRLVKAVKPKNQIDSRKYVELGKAWDKKDSKGFEKLLKKYGV